MTPYLAQLIEDLKKAEEREIENDSYQQSQTEKGSTLYGKAAEAIEQLSSSPKLLLVDNRRDTLLDAFIGKNPFEPEPLYKSIY